MGPCMDPESRSNLDLTKYGWIATVHVTGFWRTSPIALIAADLPVRRYRTSWAMAARR